MRDERQAGVSRRGFLKGAGEAGAAAVLGVAARAKAQGAGVAGALALPVLGQPDAVLVHVGEVAASRVAMTRQGSAWTGGGAAADVRVEIVGDGRRAVVSLEAATSAMQRIQLRWKRPFAVETRVLGDAWERSYGDLRWGWLEPERALPWYAVISAGGRTVGMGVKTGAASMAFWQVDPEGISLWLDVRNGSHGVSLGARRLVTATIVTATGGPDEDAFAVTQALCRRMAEGTTVVAMRGGLPVGSIYGSNDWYYAYGKNTPAGILRDAELVSSLAPRGGVRPFTVIDDGYQDPARFPDMHGLATEIRKRGAVPGIWIRPLRAAATTKASLLLPSARFRRDGGEAAPLAYDPTIPEALEAVAAVATEACGWGYDLIKHDFTTFELFGLWGSQMGASPAQGDWQFHDRSVTNAEVVTALYRRLRQSCGEERIILGCNTMGHLSVGIFDASRTGDDVSGRQWERTRRLGVNTLAFRLPQHRTFYSVDADCVPVTKDVPWSMTEQWLRVVAGTGTVLLISPEPGAVGAEQREAIRAAFARGLAAKESEPVDWLETRTPAMWRDGAGTQRYQWILPDGEDPFPIGIQRGPA